MLRSNTAAAMYMQPPPDADVSKFDAYVDKAIHQAAPSANHTTLWEGEHKTMDCDYYRNREWYISRLRTHGYTVHHDGHWSASYLVIGWGDYKEPKPYSPFI